MMSKISNAFKKFFPSVWDLLFSIILGLAISATIYLGLLQRHFFSYRYLLYAFLIFFGSSIITVWLNQRFLFPQFKKYSKEIRIFVIGISVLFTILLLLNTEVQPIYYLLPDSELEIRFHVPELPEGEEGVRLLWIETGQGYVHYTRMRIEGNWKRFYTNLVFSPNQDVRITWTGKVGDKPEIVFRQTDFDQPVEIIWNGKSQTFNLYKPKEPNIYIRTSVYVPWIFYIPFTISFLVSVGYLIFLLLNFAGSFKFSYEKSKPSRTWLLYMLPTLLFWGFSLLVFWPGIMSNDSMYQWEQGVTGDFSDWQSAFHALILAFLMRIWYSPAVISILQIVLLALVVAWGLGAMESHGIPRGILWAVSIIFALFPPNLMLTITLWKDTAYAIAFLWLSVILIQMALSNGDWIEKPLNWAALIISSLFISLFRQNGAAVSFVTLFLLPLIFRRYWKALVICFASTIFLFTLIKGPLYSAIIPNRTSTGQTNLIYLHHIAAHLDSGTPISEADREYLEQFMPLEDWDYWCCYVGTISYDREFDRSSFLDNTSKNMHLAFRLFMKNPWVDVKHMACAGELTWKFTNNQCYMKSTHGVNNWLPGKVDWIIPNDFGLEEQSLFPQMVDTFISFFRKFGFLDDMLVFYLRPAFWLYVGIFSVSIALIRRNEFRLLSLVLPILTQSLILLMVSFAPAYRYHYGTCLAGILLIGLAFLPVEKTDGTSI